MNDKITEMAEDLVHTAERRGLDLDQLISALQQQGETAASGGPPAAGGTTIAEYVPGVLRILGGKLTHCELATLVGDAAASHGSSSGRGAEDRWRLVEARNRCRGVAMGGQRG
jgi:hypothetical protein